MIALSVLMLSACDESDPTPGYSLVGTAGVVRYVVIDEGTNLEESALQAIADNACKYESICMVLFWLDRELVDRTSSPMTEEQTEAIVGRYNLNEGTGVKRLCISPEGGGCN